MATIEKKQLVNEFKEQWKSMWRDRLDDKVRAEGIARKDYSLLFVDKGTVIIATRKFRLLDFNDVLEQNKHIIGVESLPPNPITGGWGKFIRNTMSHGMRKRQRQMLIKPGKPLEQQLKKGGRGWLHQRLK